MAEAPASAEDLQREVDQVADQLYAMRPDDFAAARDEQVRKARADGKPALARELAKLRKPTISAWLINLVWRDQREVMEQLFELADELSRAQASAAGPALRELTTQRRQIEAALLRRAAALAREAGVDVSDSVVREAQETLSAALAQPDVADEVQTGRLVKPATYSGFGVLPASRPTSVQSRRDAPARGEAEAGARARAGAEASATLAEPIDLQAAQRARAEREKAERRAAAERLVAEARAAVQAASGTIAEASRAADAAQQRLADFRQRLETVREQLKRAEAEATTAEDAATGAKQRRERAEQARAKAQESLAEAERALKDAT